MIRLLQRVIVPGAAMLSIVASIAMAQVPQRLRGKIENVASQSLVVKARDGTMRNVRLADDVHVFMPKQASLSDLKHGSLIGAAAIAQADGDQKVMQIYIFPDERGHEANVLADISVEGRENEILRYTEGSVSDTKDQFLTMKYSGGEKKMTMPANVRIVLLVRATVADIKAGQYFLVPNGTPVSLGTLASTTGSNSVDFAM
jgi:hypothetical protein